MRPTSNSKLLSDVTSIGTNSSAGREQTAARQTVCQAAASDKRKGHSELLSLIDPQLHFQKATFQLWQSDARVTGGQSPVRVHIHLGTFCGDGLGTVVITAESGLRTECI